MNFVLIIALTLKWVYISWSIVCFVSMVLITAKKWLLDNPTSVGEWFWTWAFGMVSLTVLIGIVAILGSIPIITLTVFGIFVIMYGLRYLIRLNAKLKRLEL